MPMGTCANGSALPSRSNSMRWKGCPWMTSLCLVAGVYSRSILRYNVFSGVIGVPCRCQRNKVLLCIMEATFWWSDVIREQPILPHLPEKRTNFFVQAERADIQFTIALFVYIIGHTKASKEYIRSQKQLESLKTLWTCIILLSSLFWSLYASMCLSRLSLL